MQIPYVPPHLVEYLEKVYPLTEFMKVSPENLKYLQGQQNVLDHLRMLSNRQQEGNILDVSIQKT